MTNLELPEFFNATDYFLDRNIRQGRGQKIAIYTEDKNYSYSDVEKMVNKTANALHEINVRIEDKLLILMLDIPQFYAIFWAAIKIGAVPIPVNTMLTPQDYEFYLNDSRARVLALSEELVLIINEIKGATFRLSRNTRALPQNQKPLLLPGTMSASGFTAPVPPERPKAPFILSTMRWLPPGHTQKVS